FLNDAQAARHAADPHLTVLRRAAAIHDEHEALALVGADGAVGHDDRLARTRRVADLHAREQSRRECAVLVVEDRTHARRSAAWSDTVVHEREAAGMWKALLVGKAGRDR